MDYAGARRDLIEGLRRAGYVSDERVVSALLRVPREEFVPGNLRTRAYEDAPLPIGLGQTISAPHMVALMSEVLRVGESDKVLEVGCGSGYQAAVLAELAREGRVVTVERIASLADSARARLSALGYKNVAVVAGDGTQGYPPGAPYDRILVAAATLEIPPALSEQLREGGRMVIPLGGYRGQDLIVAEKKGGRLESKAICECVFVPLIGGGTR